jgi:REP element-mobilizing transposase RayT
MTSDRPFALHITWTCYGSWLPGDDRGHVSNTILPNNARLPRQNIPGTPVASGDAYTRRRARALQKGASVRLSQVQAFIAAEAIVRAARARGWRIVRGAIMSNHVHLVVMNCPPDGPTVRRVLKGTSQAALSDMSGRSQRWWTAGGSDRYKHDRRAIEAALNYVARQRGRLVEIVDMEVRTPLEQP